MSFSNYLELKILDHITSKAPYTAPTVYVALSTTTPAEDGTNITEPSAGAYARVATTGASWTAAAAGATSNASAITFPTATADWLAGANFTYVALFDAATAGNFLGYGVVNTPKPVLNGDTASFAIGNISLTLD